MQGFGLVSQQATTVIETLRETIWRRLSQVNLLSKDQDQELAQDNNYFVDHETQPDASNRTALALGSFHALNKRESAKIPLSWRASLGDKLLIGDLISGFVSWISTTHSLLSAS